MAQVQQIQGSRWGRLGELLGQNLGTGMEQGIEEHWRTKGIQQLQALIQGGAAQTPEQLYMKAMEISNPTSRQAALEMIGQIAPHLKPIQLVQGAELRRPTGELIAENVIEADPHAKAQKADVIEAWRIKDGKLEKIKRRVAVGRVLETQEALEDEGYSLTDPPKEVTLSKELKDGKISKKKAIPGTATYQKLTEKHGYKEEEIEGATSAAQMQEKRYTEIRDRVMELKHKNAFANIKEATQKQITDMTVLARHYHEQGMNVDKAIQEAWGIVSGGASARKNVPDVEKRWLTGKEKNVDDAIYGAKKAYEEGATISDLQAEMKKKGWNDKKIREVLKQSIALPEGISLEDLEYTAQTRNMTMDEVLKAYRGY